MDDVTSYDNSLDCINVSHRHALKLVIYNAYLRQRHDFRPSIFN